MNKIVAFALHVFLIQAAFAMEEPVSDSSLLAQTSPRTNSWTALPNLYKAVILLGGVALVGTTTALVVKSVGGNSSPPPAPPSPPPSPGSKGLFAAWSRVGGTYADWTDQAFRYDVSNGVVTDTLTQMQWEQAESTSAMSWSSLPHYCAAQTTGGFGDWRAPNLGELQTLVDFTLMNVVINAVAFPNTTAANFWSSSQVVGVPGNSWELQFGQIGGSPGGTSSWGKVATPAQVRCVRSAYPVPPGSRYTVVSGEVTDIVTGLIWQKVSTVTNAGYTEAETYCLGLGLNGHAWRLPTIKELLTLVDYSVSQGNLMMDSVFAGEPLEAYWSSTGYSWCVDFTSGVSFGVCMTGPGVRCVR